MEEPVTLGTDRRTLQTKAPIGGAGSVRVLANDSQYVPIGGLSSSAVLIASQAGPYQVYRCSGVHGPDANLLTITTGTGTANIRLPTGVRKTLESIQRALRLSAANDLVVVSSVGGALSLAERHDSGPSSYIRVSGRGATSLGFLQLGQRLALQITVDGKGSLATAGHSLHCRPWSGDYFTAGKYSLGGGG